MCGHARTPARNLPLPQAAQTELSKAAQDFRRLHAERQELLQQWEGVLEAIRKRDASILEAGGWGCPICQDTCATVEAGALMMIGGSELWLAGCLAPA